MLREARVHEIRPLFDQLRTPALRALAVLESNQTAQQRMAIVEALCDARLALVQKAGGHPMSADIRLEGGRLLQYEYDANVEGGAAAYESKGFFDDESAPPWDTWVCYRGDSMVAYVPRILCGLAQHGIEVDPVECVRWVDSQFLAETFGL